MGVTMSPTLFNDDIQSIDNFGPDVKTSLQRDIEAGKNSEIDTLVYSVVRLAKEYGIDTPSYSAVAAKFQMS